MTTAFLAACSSPTAPPVDTSFGPTPAAELAAAVPPEIRKLGTLIIGTDATYAPNEFRDGSGKITGFDVELFDAIAAKLNLKTQWKSSAFDEIIPGVTSGGFHVGVSSFSITSERGKVVTMVPYFTAGTQWASRSGNKVGPGTSCGRKIAVQADTIQVEDLAARSAACTHSGHAAIQVQEYKAQSDATAAVAGGRADAMLADSPVCAYAVKQSEGRLALSSAVYDSAYYGIVLPKTQAAFGRLIGDTLDLLIHEGVYAQIATKWGLDPQAFRDPSVNPTLS
ncbi:MAG: ABC transporter substrate-binding protein [Hamadaea sp.]|nr:ABC transporter substrate-binding protein [Hamadaea sp.]